MAQFLPTFLSTGSIRAATGSLVVDYIHFQANQISSSDTYASTLPDPYYFSTMSVDVSNAVSTTSSSIFEFINRDESNPSGINSYFVNNSIIGARTSLATTGVRIGLQRNIPSNAQGNIKVSSTLTAHTIACIGSETPTTFALPASMAAINTTYPCFTKSIYTNNIAGNASPINNVILLQPETNNSVTATSGSVSYNKFVGYYMQRGFIGSGSGFVGTEKSGQIVAIQSDDKIILGGIIDSYSNIPGPLPYETSSVTGRILRVDLGGNIDSTFNIGSGFDSPPTTVAIQTDGKILLGGSFSTYSGSTANGIVRLNTNGTKDASFNVGDGFGFASSISSIAIQSDGKILAGGQFTTFSGSAVTSGIIRINPSGTIDSSFNAGDGFNDGSGFSQVKKIAIQADRKILVGGGFNSYSGSSNINAITRLNLSGSIDTSFNTGNPLINPGNGFTYTVDFGFGPVTNQGTVNDIAIQSDRKIIVGGSFNGNGSVLQGDYSGSFIYNGLIRLNVSGTIDSSFDIGLGMYSGYPNCLVTQSDGKILVGGNFQEYSGSLANYFTRLNISGTIDTAFNSNICDAQVNRVAIQADKKILAVGDFTNMDNQLQYGVSRLYNTDILPTADLGYPPIYTKPIYYTSGSLKIISGSDTLTSSFLPPTASFWLSQSLTASVSNTSATAYATVFNLGGLINGQRYLANLYIIGSSAAAATGFRMRVATGSFYRGTLYTPTSTTAPAIQNSDDTTSITSITAGTWPTVNTKYLVYGEYTFIKGTTDPQVQILSETAGTAVTAFSGSVIFYRPIN